MQYLVKVAEATNVAVILTIHQPSALVFSMLDDLLLLENGQIAYGGELDDAANHFASLGCSNPEDIVIFVSFPLSHQLNIEPRRLLPRPRSEANAGLQIMEGCVRLVRSRFQVLQQDHGNRAC